MHISYISIEKFVHDRRNANWGHFTPGTDKFQKKKGNEYLFPVLVDGEQHFSCEMRLVEITASKDGKEHYWYDVRDLSIGESFSVKTNKGALLVYTRVAEDGVAAIEFAVVPN